MADYLAQRFDQFLEPAFGTRHEPHFKEMYVRHLDDGVLPDKISANYIPLKVVSFIPEGSGLKIWVNKWPIGEILQVYRDRYDLILPLKFKVGRKIQNKTLVSAKKLALTLLMEFEKSFYYDN